MPKRAQLMADASAFTNIGPPRKRSKSFSFAATDGTPDKWRLKIRHIAG
jgi:hypothetical protein